MNNLKIPTKDELETLYLQNYSMKQIGEILNMATGKIHKYFHIYNINPRNKSELMETLKIKISQVNKGNHYRSGMKNSKEHRKKISQAKKIKGIGHKKKRSDGYIEIFFPSHPKSNKDGYIMEHDLIMECNIGRWLQDDEVVHHKNKIRDDNRIENLQLMTFKEHARLHMIERHKEKEMMTY